MKNSELRFKMAKAEDLKKIACEAIDKHAGELHELSNAIWSHPELNYEEKFAHEYLTNFLEKHGFKVERHYLGIDTAFRATVGEGKPHVAVLCEYDALPEIGHACGHNLIAEVGVAAGLGIKAAMESVQGNIGKVTVFGTPAEEGGGGKVDMLDKGAFDDVDVCGMSHPYPIALADTSHAILAIHWVDVTYKGKASHAAGFPWEGVNALDAAVMAFNNISCLRQQMKPTWRVHGVILNGGTKSNIIPEMTKLEYCIRTPKFRELEILQEKVTACFKAAALATGCEVTLQWHPKPFKNVLKAPKLTELFKENATNVGVEFTTAASRLVNLAGSTDMGNVSHVVPGIHPTFSIGGDPSVINHSRPFTAIAGSDIAQKYTLDQGKALAMTGIDILAQPELLTIIKREFDEAKAEDAQG